MSPFLGFIVRSTKFILWLWMHLGILHLHVSAQNSPIDSLQKVLLEPNLHDTARVSTLNKISIEFKRTDIENSLKFALLADSLSSKIGFQKGRAESLLNTGNYYLQKSNFSKALTNFETALQIFEHTKNTEGKANSYLSIGATHSQAGNYNLALENYQLSLSLWLSTQSKHKEHIAATYNNMGVVYRIQGNFPKAIEYYQSSLLLKEEIGDRAGMADTYNNIGVIYRIQLDYSKALNYYFKSLEIRQKIGYTRGVAMNYNNIGIVYSEMGDFSSALEYFKESLNIRIDLNDKRGVAHIYNNIGQAYAKLNELHLSFEYYEKGLTLAREIAHKPVEAHCLLGLGEVMLKQGKYSQSYSYSQQALKLALVINDYTITEKIADVLTKSSEALGLYQKAYEYHVLYKAMSDSIINQKNTKKIVGLEYEYKYQKDRVEQEKKDFEQQARYVRQKQVTFIFISGFVLTLALVTIVLRSYRRKQRDYQIISNQKRLLQEQAAKLKDLDEIKSRFFTNISHEFRTPLSLIIGPIEQLLAKPHDPTVKFSLSIALQNAKNLLGLINQLLNISKIEKGAVRVSLCHGDIKEEVERIVYMFQLQAQAKGLTINLKVSAADYHCHFDRQKLERILFNLISNALKNTQAGGVSIQMEWVNQPNRIRIEVADTGTGIEPDKLQYIFDRFYMATEGETDMGTGIGLAFTKELVNVYRGEISATSELGNGTKFTLELPASLQEFPKGIVDFVQEEITYTKFDGEADNTICSNTPEVPGGNTEQKTILLVEDHHELRGFIRSNLCDSYTIIEAENGEEGIELALSHLPDLIVTDVMMPKVDGIELAKTLKSTESTSHIPIVMLTAKASEESKIQGLLTRVDDYLTKPFSIRELKLRIQNILTIREELRQKYMRNITVSSTEITTNSIDEQFVARVLKVVEDNMSDPNFSVDFLCEKAGVSRSTLHVKLKSLLNQSATEFINCIRIKRAAQLMLQKVGNVSEIAYDVGFTNLSYFTKVFKKQMGKTPSEMMG